MHKYTRRRQQELVKLVVKLRRIIDRHVPTIMERLRGSCAMRVVAFMQEMETSRCTMAAVTVRRFLDSVRGAQSHWRMMLQVWGSVGVCVESHGMALQVWQKKETMSGIQDD